MSANPVPPDRSLLGADYKDGQLDEIIGDVVLSQTPHNNPQINVPVPLVKGVKSSPWQIFLASGFLGLNVMIFSIVLLLIVGIGVWGNNQPTGWGCDIINFVWWIGIGHAGTLISAILLLLRQRWRNAINRMAEAMTIFAVMCAGLFPLLHTGRPWVAYWLFPYPNVMGLWPQFRSPLIWDVFAVSTYFTVSIIFWYIGLVPDLGTLRDRSRKKLGKVVYGILSLGWRGSAKHWQRYEHAGIMLAGISAPLVLSVHTIVSFDFAMAVVPGWRPTIFPPYFVAGAVFAGFAMVILFAIPLRKWYKLENVITMKHFDWMAKIMLATGLIVAYGYFTEAFYAYYSGEPLEQAFLHNHVNLLHAPYSWSYWLLILCNVLIPQLMWFPKMRKSMVALFLVALDVNIGMWLERYVIIPVNLTRDFLPSSFGYYTPSPVDVSMFIGTIGMFVFLMFLFVRFLPMINIFEVKELAHQMHASHDPHAEPEAAGAH